MPALTLSVSSSKGGISVQLETRPGTVLADGSNKTSKKDCPEPHRTLIVNIRSRSHRDREPPFPLGIKYRYPGCYDPSHLGWLAASVERLKVQDKDDTTSYWGRGNCP